MSEDTYKTIAVPSEGIYTEKRSKFIAIALPVRTVEEVKAHLETYQKKYYDARHVVLSRVRGTSRISICHSWANFSHTTWKPVEITKFGLSNGLPCA